MYRTIRILSEVYSVDRNMQLPAPPTFLTHDAAGRRNYCVGLLCRAGFSWWEAWGTRDVGISLKFGEQVEVKVEIFFTLWCING